MTVALTSVPRTAGELADALVASTAGHLDRLAAGATPGLVPPAVFGGHVVDDQTVSDVVYTVAHLAASGVPTVAGIDLAEHAGVLVRALRADEVEAFAAYRIGEATQLVGDAWDEETRRHAIACADSTPLFDRVRAGETPRNYAVVAARCLWASAALGGGDADHLDEFLERSRGLFDTETGWINDGMGSTAQYDIYTPDMYLFAEPLAARLGACWTDGLASVLADLEDLGHPGGAVVWGRSVGSLGLAITIELAAIAVGRDLTSNTTGWLRRAVEALDELNGWFHDGVVAAHQDRSTMWYRGPARRLQLTFDLLGKLLLAAGELRRAPDAVVGDAADAWPDVDRVVPFTADGRAGAWTVRRRGLGFVVPMLDGRATDYLATPRGPGTLEQPTSGTPTLTPLPVVDGRLLTTSGLPSSWRHRPGELTMRFDRWWHLRRSLTEPAAEAVEGERATTMRVDGRSLEITEELSLPGRRVMVATAVAESPRRPLLVEADGPVRRADTAGIAEWRSFWGPLPVVHQIEHEVDGAATHRVRVTPVPRVAGSVMGHPYEDQLYEPLGARVHRTLAPRADAVTELKLRDVDVLHLAWPEWWSGLDPDRTARMIERVRRAGVRVLWTQHNLAPHRDKSDDARACYQQWAEVADAVIHHTAHGRDVALREYTYGPHTRHRVIRHGHWGPTLTPHLDTPRADVESAEGWPSAGLRVAVVGAPRAEKDLEGVIAAMRACSRDDLQLVIRADDRVGAVDDPRILVDRGHVDAPRYARRLAAIDALILPFASDGMLTTGTAFDAIGAGVAAITSAWGFFDETFAGADIGYRTLEELTEILETLDADRLAASAAGIAARRADHDWADSAEATLALIEELLT